MTGSISIADAGAGDTGSSQVLVQEVIRQARSLGLTWTLRMGTIVTSDPLAILLDGDTQNLSAVSIIGEPEPSQRVYALIIPPSGLFICGIVPPILGSVFGALPRMGCTLRRVANQALPDFTFTPVSWDTEDADTDDMWSSGTDITIPADGDGVWAVSFGVGVPVVPTGISLIVVRVNGTNVCGYPFIPNTGSSSATIVRPMVAGDIVTAAVLADTASGTTMTADITVYRVSR